MFDLGVAMTGVDKPFRVAAALTVVLSALAAVAGCTGGKSEVDVASDPATESPSASTESPEPSEEVPELPAACSGWADAPTEGGLHLETTRVEFWKSEDPAFSDQVHALFELRNDSELVAVEVYTEYTMHVDGQDVGDQLGFTQDPAPLQYGSSFIDAAGEEHGGLTVFPPDDLRFSITGSGEIADTPVLSEHWDAPAEWEDKELEVEGTAVARHWCTPITSQE